MMCPIPARRRKQEVRGLLFNLVDQYGAGVPVRLALQLPLDDPAWYSIDSEALETKAQGLDAYMWLALKLGTSVFIDFEEAARKRAIVSRMLEDALMRISEAAKDSNEAQALAAERRRRSQHSLPDSRQRRRGGDARVYL